MVACYSFAMGRVLLTAIFLTAAAPASAFDLSEFLAGLLDGKPVAVQPEEKVAKPKAAPVVPAQDDQDSRKRDKTLSPRAVWMIGVFR
jgi:hypothetical protein